MDCKEVSGLLAAYLDNEVTAEERRQIDAHLAVCKSCRQELADLAAAQNSLRRAFKEATSDTGLPRDAWKQIEPGLGVYRPSFLFLLRTRKRLVIATIAAIVIIVTLAVLWGLGILPGLR
jgi:predicted anti-sigma-YlaC factor YlaD